MTAHSSSADHTSLLRDSVADFTARATDIARVRRMRDAGQECDRALWSRMAELGWLGILIPERCGGLGLGLGEAAIVAQGLSGALVPEPYTAVAVLSATALVEADDMPLRELLLREIAAGECIVALAWQEAAGELDVTGSAAQAAPFEGGYRLDGVKRYVAGGMAADGYIVTARTAEGDALFWVPRDSGGVTVSGDVLADGRHWATLRLQDARVPAAHRLACGASARLAIAAARDSAAMTASAELLGAMQRVLDMSLDYMRTRVQFGRPIGSFQALQHRAVDLYIQRDLASAVLEEGLRRWSETDHPAARAALASRVKARCSDAGLRIAREAIQIHGAIGFTDEYDAGLYLKRALVLASWLGNAGAHRRRYAQLALVGDGASPANGASPMASRAQPAPDARRDGSADYNAMSDAAFRQEVRSFFERHYPQHLRYILRRARWDEMRGWWRTLYEHGWIAPNWPREHGGMGLDAGKMVIFLEEMERHGVARPPDQGITQVGPILMKFGTPAQQAYYLPRTLSGVCIWCQGYSEPNAGSDLASLQTAAVVDGERFVINGQKIWTSMAHDATHIYLLVRTDRRAKKQEGISFLLVDLKTPGITVRPIRNIAGHEEFCEVFFDDVRVPLDALVGELNAGWTVAKALLGYERLNIGSPRRPQYALRRLEILARAQGLFSDPGFVDRYTALALDIEDLGALYSRYVEQVKRGEPLGHDVSSLKIWGMEAWQRLTELLVETGAEEGVTEGVRAVYGAQVDFLTPFYYARPATIYGGSSEIQRNIMAKYVLKLP